MAALSSAEAERFRSFERRRHDEMAQSYHDFFSPITLHAIAPMLKAVRLARGQRLLDVASGPGALAAAAAQAGARAVGTDLSPKMVELAARTYPDVEFRVAEVEHLPFADGAFDAVACNFGIGHFPNPEASVAECMRVLKCGGHMALAWWEAPDKQRVQGLFREAIAEIGAKPPPDVPVGNSMLRFTDAGELRKLLEDTGLTGVVLEGITITHVVPDIETLWCGGLGSMAVTASAVTNQDATTQAAIRGAFERRAAAYKAGKGLALPVSFRIASGSKP